MMRMGLRLPLLVQKNKLLQYKRAVLSNANHWGVLKLRAEMRSEIRMWHWQQCLQFCCLKPLKEFDYIIYSLTRLVWKICANHCAHTHTPSYLLRHTFNLMQSLMPSRDLIRFRFHFVYSFCGVAIKSPSRINLRSNPNLVFYSTLSFLLSAFLVASSVRSIYVQPSSILTFILPLICLPKSRNVALTWFAYWVHQREEGQRWPLCLSSHTHYNDACGISSIIPTLLFFPSISVLMSYFQLNCQFSLSSSA